MSETFRVHNYMGTVRVTRPQLKVLKTIFSSYDDLKVRVGSSYKSSIKALVSKGLVRELKAGVKRTKEGTRVACALKTVLETI